MKWCGGPLRCITFFAASFKFTCCLCNIEDVTQKEGACELDSTTFLIHRVNEIAKMLHLKQAYTFAPLHRTVYKVHLTHLRSPKEDVKKNKVYLK